MKKRTLNEYRQTKEYQGSKEGRKYLDLENTKEEKLKKLEEAHKLNDAAKAKLHEFKDVEFDDLETPSQSFIEDQEAAKQLAESKEADSVESTKELIINKIIKHFDDALFEMVSEEMSRKYVFQEHNYLTEAGMDEFEDAWFEWYHNHHGDILYEVKKNLFE